MLIKEANKDKINEMIKKAEGRAKERTITYTSIEKAITRIEERLGIHKTDMEGIVAYIDCNAQNFPRAYKWTANSTQFCIKKKKSGWDLLGVYRESCNREARMFELKLTDRAKEAIIEANTIFR